MFAFFGVNSLNRTVNNQAQHHRLWTTFGVIKINIKKGSETELPRFSCLFFFSV